MKRKERKKDADEHKWSCVERFVEAHYRRRVHRGKNARRGFLEKVHENALTRELRGRP